MGLPPTWEKGSHLPPGTTNLRDDHVSITAPIGKPDQGYYSSVLSLLRMPEM